MDKIYVIGDIHGAYRALEQCFERSSFNMDRDTLICLGDVCDGWPDISKVFEIFLKIKNLVYIMGNHDYWALEWMNSDYSEEIWLNQGGQATVNSYKKQVPETHKNFLSTARYYYELNNRLFVHGGFNPKINIEYQLKYELIWDRSLVNEAIKLYAEKKDNINLSKYKEVFVGHTPTLNYGSTQPIKACEVWLMDTGAGWTGGLLSMMNIETKELFQSDRVDKLYKEYKGRSKW